MKNLCCAILLLTITVWMASCGKPHQDLPSPPVNPPDSTPVMPPKDSLPFVRAAFSVQGNCNASFTTDTLQNLFSSLLFINMSDTGTHVRYHWSFGDGSVSDSISPTHAYQAAGTYPVQLIAYYDTVPKDTTTRLLRIIIGQKSYGFDKYNIDVQDADAAPDDGAMVLVAAFRNNAYNYALLQTDSLLNQTYYKPLPATITRLNSLKRTSAGNYILSGNYNNGNTNEYALSLIDGSGNLIWEKYLPVQGQNYYTAETKDGGFITIGDEQAGNGKYTTVVKCSSDGTEQWRRSFNSLPYISDADAILETAGGYVFAALRNQQDTTHSGYAMVVTQLDLNGQVLQQQSASISGGTIVGARAAIAQTGTTLFAYRQFDNSVFIFDNSLHLLQQAKEGNSPVNRMYGFSNRYYAASGTPAIYGDVFSCDEQGTAQWLTPVPILTTTCTISYGSFVRACKCLVKGNKDFIAVTFGDDGNSIGRFGTFLNRVAYDGQLR